MKKAIIYVHGKGGNASEADYYKKLCPGYDIYGIDYTECLPWIVREQIKTKYDELTKQYDEISLITNSIGTFFAMLALQKCELRKAYCISPILNMERLITDMMCWAGVSEDELKEKKEIATDFGETLSWEYLCYVRNNPVKWTIPTAVLYAGNDNLTARTTVDEFVKHHNASLTVMENGEHWFHTKEQLDFLDEWMKKELQTSGEEILK